MTDPDFWKQLSNEFLSLDPEGLVGLLWTYFPASKKYYFGFRHEKSDELIRARFDALAARAGQIANHAEPRYAWLVEIRKHSENDKPNSGKQFDPETGEMADFISGEVSRPCHTSAIICCKYEEWSATRTSRQRGPVIPKEGKPITVYQSPLDTLSRRAQWLQGQLDARDWDRNDLERFHGPDHKTTKKILEGKSVGPGVLRKVMTGLNSHRTATRVKFEDIPSN